MSDISFNLAFNTLSSIVSNPWPLLLAFPILYFVVGLAKGQEELSGPVHPSEYDRLNRDKANYYTLAGFSIAAVAFFAAVGSGSLPYSTLTSSQGLGIFYLSLSFVSFIVASYLTGFRRYYLWSYIAETLELTGMLAIGIGFLAFFSGLNLPETSELQALFWGFYLFIFLFGIQMLRADMSWWRQSKNPPKASSDPTEP